MLLVAISHIPPVSGQSVDGLLPAIVFLRGPVSDPKAGSGFLLKTEDQARLFVVTAAHVAAAMGERGWSIYIRGSDGKPVRLRVKTADWKVSSEADVAMGELPLDSFAEETRKGLVARGVPARMLTARSLPPGRDVPLTAIGFPQALGAIDFSDKSGGPSATLSPLIIETKAASGLMTLPRLDTKKPASFIVLQVPSIAGMSGGPVWDTGRSYMGTGRRLISRSGHSLVGLMHGTLGDRTGGKLAMVVPSTEIQKLLEETLSDR